MKGLAVLLIVLFALSGFDFTPPFAHAAIISQPLIPFTGTVLSKTAPPSIGMGTDKGTNTFAFTGCTVSWARPDGNMSINLCNSSLGLTPLALSGTKNSSIINQGFITAGITFNSIIKNTTKDPYSRLIEFKGTQLVATTMKVTLLNKASLPVSKCDNEPQPQNGGVLFQCTQECFGTMCFNWAGDAATWDNSTLTLTYSLGTVFDQLPIAVDGTASGSAGPVTSFTLSGLTTANTNDVIIVYSSGGASTSSISDTAGLTWATRLQHLDSGVRFEEEDYAVSAAKLTGDVITVHLSSSTFAEAIAFGVSGANTGSSEIFDPNSAVPNFNDGLASIPTVTGISTTNANDMLLGMAWGETQFTQVAGTGYTLFIDAKNAIGTQSDAQDKVVSATQSSVSVAFGNPLPASKHWTMIADAICQSGSQCGPNQPIKITNIYRPGAPDPTLTITGCSVTPTTIVADSSVHTVNANPSCSLTLTEPAATTVRHGFDGFQHSNGHYASTWVFSTCASGTCAEKDNTSYYQLQNNFTATPQTPTTWDAVYSTTWTATLLGTFLTTAGTPTTSGGGVYLLTEPFTDYNKQVCLQNIGNTWITQSPNCFTPTTASNVFNVNYKQITSSSGADPPNYLWLLALPILLITLVALKKRR